MNEIVWHHGTCDYCKRKNTMIIHFGYDTQPRKDYRMCLKCLSENAQLIMYGWMDYKIDKTIDNLGKCIE